MPRIPNCNMLNKRQRRGERVGEGVHARKLTERPKAKTKWTEIAE